MWDLNLWSYPQWYQVLSASFKGEVGGRRLSSEQRVADWEEFGADKVGGYYLVGSEEEPSSYRFHLTEWDGGSVVFDGSPLGLLSQAEICQWLHPHHPTAQTPTPLITNCSETQE